MKPRLICWIVILFIIIPAVSFSQRIYLSPGGNDSNPGSRDKPLASLTAARDKARELRRSNKVSGPVEIIALPGEYFMLQPLILTEEDSGTEGTELIFKAETGSRAVFRGGVRLGGFEKTNDGMWKAFVPQVAWYNSYFEQLYVNGRRAVRARTPDKGFYNVRNAAESVLIKGDEPVPKLALHNIKLDSADALFLKNFSEKDFRDAVVTFYHKWDNTMKHIEGFDASVSTIYVTGTGMQPWNKIDSQTRYYIDNFKSALNAPGEWYLDRSGYLYYVPQQDEVIETTSFFAPVLNEFLVIMGDTASGALAEHIHFRKHEF